MPSRILGIVLVVVVATVLTGCVSPAPSALGVPVTAARTPKTTAASAGAGVSPSLTSAVSVTALGHSLPVHPAPDRPANRTLTNPQATGAPLTLLVTRQDGIWLQVLLPVRPNGSTGWVRASEVLAARVPYRIEISTKAHRLTLYKSGQLVATYPVATGTGGTPTPLGSFFLTELLAPTNAGYGQYAYGLSAFSDALTSFVGGPGQIGLHGTAEAGSIGRSSSHGCIRLSNGDIAALAKVLPLGTPVNIA